MNKFAQQLTNGAVNVFSATMNFREHKFILVCMVVALALCGVFGAMACDCHSNGLKCDANSCACDCFCCGNAAGSEMNGPVCVKDRHLPVIAQLPMECDGWCGRLVESFIFTPPRA